MRQCNNLPRDELAKMESVELLKDGAGIIVTVDTEAIEQPYTGLPLQTTTPKSIVKSIDD